MLAEEFAKNKAERGFGLLVRTAKPSETCVTRPSTNVAHCCLTSVNGQIPSHCTTILESLETNKSDFSFKLVLKNIFPNTVYGLNQYCHYLNPDYSCRVMGTLQGLTYG